MAAPPILQEMALLLAAAVLIVFAFRKLRQPAILGFLVAGTLIGPHGFAIVRSVEAVETMAEVGVILLLFAIGLEFSIARLSRIRYYVILGGGAQALVTILIVVAGALWLGLEWRRGIFWGAAFVLSSTAIVLRLLSDQRQLDSLGGQLALGILLFQDLLVVPIMLGIPLLAGGLAGGTSDVFLAVAKAAGVLAGVFIFARYIAPRILHQVTISGSRELFTLTLILFALGTAILTSLAGLSMALGAFLAGLMIAESEYGEVAMSEILPIHDALSGVFFISVGMLLNWKHVYDHAASVTELSLAIIVLKSVSLAGVTWLLTHSVRTSVFTGLILSQIGEFSFLVARHGFHYSLVDEEAYQSFLAASIITMLATPFLMRAAPFIAIALEGYGDHAVSLGREWIHMQSDPPEQRKEHVILVGYGLTGRHIARVLRETGIDFVGLDMNASRAAIARRDGWPVLYGDATRRTVLRMACVESARVLVVAVPDPVATRRIVVIARKMHPQLHILVRTHYVGEIDELLRQGANEVVPEEFETSIELFALVLRQYHIPNNVIALQRGLIRQSGYGILREGAAPESTLHLTEILAASATQTALVFPDSVAVGRTLADLQMRKTTGASVLAIVRGNAPITNPGGDEALAAGDIVVLMGTHAAIDAAIELLASRRALQDDDPPPLL